MLLRRFNKKLQDENISKCNTNIEALEKRINEIDLELKDAVGFGAKFGLEFEKSQCEYKLRRFNEVLDMIHENEKDPVAFYNKYKDEF